MLNRCERIKVLYGGELTEFKVKRDEHKQRRVKAGESEIIRLTRCETVLETATCLPIKLDLLASTLFTVCSRQTLHKPTWQNT